MKCPKCSSNHKRKSGMRCDCGYQFVFDPKVDKIADGKFAAALSKASANDTNYFTQNQLDAAIRRANAKNPRTAGLVCLVFVLVLVAA